MTLLDLPVVNATLNGLSAIFLTLGFIFIKRGHKIAHRWDPLESTCRHASLSIL